MAENSVVEPNEDLAECARHPAEDREHGHEQLPDDAPDERKRREQRAQHVGDGGGKHLEDAVEYHLQGQCMRGQAGHRRADNAGSLAELGHRSEYRADRLGRAADYRVGRQRADWIAPAFRQRRKPLRFGPRLLCPHYGRLRAGHGCLRLRARRAYVGDHGFSACNRVTSFRLRDRAACVRSGGGLRAESWAKQQIGEP